MLRSRSTASLALLLFALLPACTGDGTPASDDDGCDTACEDESGGASGGGGSETTAEDDGPDPDDGSGDYGEPSGPAVPCENQELLREHCGDCHADPPRYGDPMPPAGYDHFQVPAA